MDKLFQRLKCRNALIFTFLAFYAVFITMQSTLAPYSKVMPWVDSHVFIYVATGSRSTSITTWTM